MTVMFIKMSLPQEDVVLEPAAITGSACPSPGDEARGPAVVPELGAAQLVCRRCGRVEWLDDPALLAPGRAIARDHGFTLEVISSVQRGTCRSCRRLRAGGSH